MRTSPTNARKHRDRSGTAYIIVVGMTMLVGVTTMGILQSTRVRGRTIEESMDAAVARQCALDGVQAAKLWIRKDPNWRLTRPAGVWVENLAMGSGTVTIEASDPVDGIVSKGQHDALRLKCIGKKGSARSIVSVTLQARPIPLPALAYAAHTGGDLWVLSGKTLRAPGSVISANKKLNNQGIITGGIHVSDVRKLGSVSGSPIVTNAGEKVLPDQSVIDKYSALGTVISAPLTIELVALGPGHNPFGGGTNPQGIYVIHANSDVTIKNARIHGTLIIVAPGKTVKLDDRVFLQPSRADYPTLLIKGDAEFVYTSDGATLSETLHGRNFNPPGVPYNGTANSSMLDSYPSEVQGLVHVTGDLNMKQTARIRGAVMVGGTGPDSIKIEDTPEIIYTPSLFINPPQWYTAEVRMPILRGSWLQPSN